MQMSENKMISIYLRRWAPKDAAAVCSDVIVPKVRMSPTSALIPPRIGADRR
jgi:hypothetical protein